MKEGKRKREGLKEGSKKAERNIEAMKGRNIRLK
jgi:hypothetical protein